MLKSNFTAQSLNLMESLDLINRIAANTIEILKLFANKKDKKAQRRR